jgi:hypothetical protein
MSGERTPVTLVTGLVGVSKTRLIAQSCSGYPKRVMIINCRFSVDLGCEEDVNITPAFFFLLFLLF